MNRNLLVTTAVLLSACGPRVDKNAPSAELFTSVIKADARASRDICDTVNTGVDRLPAKFDLSAEKDSFFQKYRTLQKHGYATIQRVKTTDPYGGRQIEALAVDLTPKWTTDFESKYGGPQCYARWTAENVKEFSEPVEVQGVKVSQATVVGSNEYVGWAQNKDMRAAFSMIDLPPQSERTYTLALKDDAWTVINAQR